MYNIIVPILVLCQVASPAVSATLSGRVIDDHSQPMAGATVAIYSARPRDGLGTLCPSSYRDCSKFTTTDNAGQFAFEDVDSALVFRIVVAAPGWRSSVTEHWDPLQTGHQIVLQRLPVELPDERILRGRVVDANGMGVAGAIIEPYGAETYERQFDGALPGVDTMVVSDQEGDFSVSSIDPMKRIRVKVSARELAKTITPLLPLNGKRHTITLHVGAFVTGKLEYLGQPVGGRAIGMVQADRSADNFVGDITSVTDEQGCFKFSNLQPNCEYVIYTLCDPYPVPTATSKFGRLTMNPQLVTTGQENEVQNVETLELMEGRRLSGQVILPVGEVIPANATIQLHRTKAWDWATAAIDGEGHFSISDLPPEIYHAHLNTEGFEIDLEQFTSHQLLAPQSFGIRMLSDRQGLVIPLRRTK